MYQVIIVLHVLVGLAVIGLILIQHGKGADAGAAFGSGSSGTVFGAQGSASFLSRATGVLATVFFSTSLALAVLSGNFGKVNADIMDAPIVTPISEQLEMEVPTVDGEAVIRTPTEVGEELPQIEEQVEVIQGTAIDTSEVVKDSVVDTKDSAVEIVKKATAVVEEGLPQIVEDEVIVIDNDEVIVVDEIVTP